MEARLLIIAGILAFLFFNACQKEEALSPKAPIANAIADTPIIESGKMASITLNSDVSTAIFKWTVVANGVSGASGGTGHSIVQTLNATGVVAGTATYIITPQANGVEGNPVSVKITVKPIIKITYLADVKQIFTTSCTPCHMPEGYNSVKLDNYSVAKSKINNILDRVQRAQGTSGFMPQGGTKLSAANIATLKKWLADGLPEQ